MNPESLRPDPLSADIQVTPDSASQHIKSDPEIFKGHLLQLFDEVNKGGRDAEYAFETLCRDTRPQLAGFIHSRTRNYYATELCLQGTYIKVWFGIPQFGSDKPNPWAWMLTIATNEVHDFFKDSWQRRLTNGDVRLLGDTTSLDRPKDRDTYAERETVGVWRQPVEAYDEGDNPWKGPEGPVIQGALREILKNALSELTAEHREVITLRFLEELSSGETAARLNITKGAVRSKQYRALRLLRHIMDTHYNDVL